MTKDANMIQAEIILESAIQFLADKHGVFAAEIWQALKNKQTRVCNQLAELIALAIKEVQKK